MKLQNKVNSAHAYLIAYGSILLNSRKKMQCFCIGRFQCTNKQLFLHVLFLQKSDNMNQQSKSFRFYRYQNFISKV